MLFKRIAACIHLSSTVSKQFNPEFQKFAGLAFFAHFGLPGYAPGTIAVNYVRWIEREFDACQSCQTPRNMYPSIFNRFPVIQPESSKVRHFSTFLAHFGLLWYVPGTIAVNVTWMERGFNACKTAKTPRCIDYTHLSSTISDI